MLIFCDTTDLSNAVMKYKTYLWNERALFYIDNCQGVYESAALVPTLLISSKEIHIEYQGSYYTSSIYLIPPGKTFRYHPTNCTVTLLTLIPGVNEDSDLLSQGGWKPHSKGLIHTKNDPEMQQHFMDIGHHQLPHHFVTQYVYMALYGERNISLPTLDKRLIEVLVYIMEHPATDISVADMASKVHLSASHFAAWFKRQTGLSFNRYKIASKLLYFFEIFSPELNLTDLALKAGFYDLSHLTKAFSQYCSLSPDSTMDFRKDLEIVRDSKFNRSWYANWLREGYQQLSRHHKELPVNEFLERAAGF